MFIVMHTFTACDKLFQSTTSSAMVILKDNYEKLIVN